MVNFDTLLFERIWSIPLAEGILAPVDSDVYSRVKPIFIFDGLVCCITPWSVVNDQAIRIVFLKALDDPLG